MTSIKSNIPYAPHRVGNCSVDFDTPDDFQKFCRSMTKSRAIKGSSKQDKTNKGRIQGSEPGSLGIPCSRKETSAISAIVDACRTYHIQPTIKGRWRVMTTD
ncbi:hypothetical protein V6Z93_004145 [Aspergillus fumigatus]